MQNKNNSRNYNKIFKEWNNRRTQLKFRETIIYTPQPDEIFRQCYLPASKKKEKFYKLRHVLPKYWFISNYGTIISVSTGAAELIVGQFTGYDRLQVSFRYNQDKFTIAREAIVALVFNDMIDCTEEAAKLIEEKGLEAFRRRRDMQCVELHHIKGYIHPETPLNILQIMQNLPSNCKPDAIQLVTRLEHLKIHHPIPTAA